MLNNIRVVNNWFGLHCSCWYKCSRYIVYCHT